MKKRRQINLWLLLGFALAGLLPSFWMGVAFQLPVSALWPEIIVDVSALASSFLLATWFLNAYPTKAGLQGYAVFTGLIVGLIAGFANTNGLRFLNHRWTSFPENISEKTYYFRYLTSIAIFTCYSVIRSSGRRMSELDERFRRQQDAAELLKEAELLKLRQQLQPHFLFNSLNSISSLILIAPDRAQEMTGQLAHFLRLSVKQDDREAVPVAEELEYIEAYLTLESIRFGDRLHVEFIRDIEDDMRMPRHLLQPLVENAVKYSLHSEDKKVGIKIMLSGNDTMLYVNISNPYNPVSAPSRGAGFGLEGVRRRLYLLFARTDLLETSASGATFTTTLKIPQLHHVSLPHH